MVFSVGLRLTRNGHDEPPERNVVGYLRCLRRLLAEVGMVVIRHLLHTYLFGGIMIHLQHWSEERIRETMYKTNRHFRKTLQIELSWRQHLSWKRQTEGE